MISINCERHTIDFYAVVTCSYPENKTAIIDFLDKRSIIYFHKSGTLHNEDLPNVTVFYISGEYVGLDPLAGLIDDLNFEDINIRTGGPVVSMCNKLGFSRQISIHRKKT